MPVDERFRYQHRRAGRLIIATANNPHGQREDIGQGPSHNALARWLLSRYVALETKRLVNTSSVQPIDQKSRMNGRGKVDTRWIRSAMRFLDQWPIYFSVFLPRTSSESVNPVATHRVLGSTRRDPKYQDDEERTADLQLGLRRSLRPVRATHV